MQEREVLKKRELSEIHSVQLYASKKKRSTKSKLSNIQIVKVYGKKERIIHKAKTFNKDMAAKTQNKNRKQKNNSPQNILQRIQN